MVRRDQNRCRTSMTGDSNTSDDRSIGHSEGRYSKPERFFYDRTVTADLHFLQLRFGISWNCDISLNYISSRITQHF